MIYVRAAHVFYTGERSNYAGTSFKVFVFAKYIIKYMGKFNNVSR